MALHIADDQMYKKYAVKQKLTKSFFIRTMETCPALEYELDKVEN
jgi:hypothetical protein